MQRTGSTNTTGNACHCDTNHHYKTRYNSSNRCRRERTITQIVPTVARSTTIFGAGTVRAGNTTGRVRTSEIRTFASAAVAAITGTVTVEAA